MADQEQLIRDHLEDGEHDEIDALRDDAYAAEPIRPEDAPEGWLPPVEQFEADRRAAWNRYQADHEMPEKDREKNAKDKAAKDNQQAKDKEKPPKALKVDGEEDG